MNKPQQLRIDEQQLDLFVAYLPGQELEPAGPTCHFCGGTGRGINASHWDGSEYVRVFVCSSSECRDRIASAPRSPRRPRRQPVIAGEWGLAVLIGNPAAK